MKKTLVLLCSFFCLSSCSTLIQHVSNPYMDAYKFIVKDIMAKRKHVAVRDSLYEFDKNMAMTLINESAYTSIGEIDTHIYPTTGCLTHQVTVKVNKPVYLLQFSKMENNMMMAEIIDYHHYIQFKNDIFTTVRIYLFIFDEKMRIKRVSSVNMQSE